VGFDVDDLEFIEGDWEHGEDFVMEKSEVCSNEVVFVYGRGSSASAIRSSTMFGSALVRDSIAVNL